MGKIKRIRKISVHGVLEGKRYEEDFWTFIKELYEDKSCFHVVEAPDKGGSSDKLIGIALKNLRERNFVWIDEDKPISGETRQRLFREWRVDDSKEKDFLECPPSELQDRYNAGRRNPILIVSTPIAAECLIYDILAKKKCDLKYDSCITKKQSTPCKNKLNGLLGGSTLLEYCRSKIRKNDIEGKRKEISQLDLLISMLEKS